MCKNSWSQRTGFRKPSTLSGKSPELTRNLCEPLCLHTCRTHSLEHLFEICVKIISTLSQENKQPEKSNCCALSSVPFYTQCPMAWHTQMKYDTYALKSFSCILESSLVINMWELQGFYKLFCYWSNSILHKIIT